MNAHAWASARVVHEHTVARDTLEAGIHKLLEDEKDQGRSSHLVFKSTFGMHTICIAPLQAVLFAGYDC